MTVRLKQGAPSLVVYQTFISVECVYGLVQSPLRHGWQKLINIKDLGKSVVTCVTCNFRFVASKGTGPQAELLQGERG